jgi:Xaa-Pro aminopeptidase
MKNKPEATLISSVPNIIYLTNYSGFSETEREAFILLTKNKKYIITDKRYSEAVEKIKGFEIIDCGANYFISKLSKEFFKENNIKTLAIEENNITLFESKLLKKSAKLIPSDFSKKRVLKTEKEIENIKKACDIGDEAFKFILTKLKVGVSENDISEELISFFKSKNADFSFKPIVAFGAHSSIPHHKTEKTKLEKNQIVLLDFGVKVNNYCSDMTRTVYFGKADEKFKKIYNTVLNAQKKAIEQIKENANLSLIDKTAREFILEQGFSNIIHAVGHGIGIEVHEAPSVSPYSKNIIKNGMVFSVEPGIYIPEFGGARIEDLVVVRNGKAQLISHAEREIIEIHD